MKTPAYAKVKTITSMSGANAAHKHVATLQRAQTLLEAQGDEAGRYAAGLINATVEGYLRELRAFYNSEHYPYRNGVA